ncbi:hypothetical protein [Streptomyces niveus]
MDPEQPPGGGESEDGPEPPEPPAEEHDPRCLLDVELAAVDISVGALLCL